MFDENFKHRTMEIVPDLREGNESLPSHLQVSIIMNKHPLNVY